MFKGRERVAETEILDAVPSTPRMGQLRLEDLIRGQIVDSRAKEHQVTSLWLQRTLLCVRSLCQPGYRDVCPCNPALLDIASQLGSHNVAQTD